MGLEIVGVRIQGPVGTSKHELFVDETVDFRDVAGDLGSPERGFTLE
jgi:hypothetical protein